MVFAQRCRQARLAVAVRSRVRHKERSLGKYVCCRATRRRISEQLSGVDTLSFHMELFCLPTILSQVGRGVRMSTPPRTSPIAEGPSEAAAAQVPKFGRCSVCTVDPLLQSRTARQVLRNKIFTYCDGTVAQKVLSPLRQPFAMLTGRKVYVP
jgi:hypothetical protein